MIMSTLLIKRAARMHKAFFPLSFRLYNRNMSSSHRQTDEDVLHFIIPHLKHGQVNMWTISGCPFCRNAMQLLEARKLPYAVHEIDSLEEERRIRKALIEFTRHATFPNIFIGSTHIGGYTELKRLDDNG